MIVLPQAVWDRLLAFEGVYSNDQQDPGGMTLYGIARNRNPHWPGWIEVDSGMKNGLLDPSALEPLKKLARAFYAEKWTLLRCPEYTHQTLAEYVFDSAVNTGARRAHYWLQTALNALNDGGRLWGDIPVDGLIGPRTLVAEARSGLSPRRDQVLFAVRVLRSGYYMNLIEHSPARWERFAAGWLKRAAS